jgi:hypothetical protein
MYEHALSSGFYPYLSHFVQHYTITWRFCTEITPPQPLESTTYQYCFGTGCTGTGTTMGRRTAPPGTPSRLVLLAPVRTRYVLLRVRTGRNPEPTCICPEKKFCLNISWAGFVLSFFFFVRLSMKCRVVWFFFLSSFPSFPISHTCPFPNNRQRYIKPLPSSHVNLTSILNLTGYLEFVLLTIVITRHVRLRQPL